MVYVPEARKFGFDLRLNEDVMREVLNGEGVTRFVHETAATAQADIETHVRATASGNDAENYVAALFAEDSYSDNYGFDFGGPYGLGSRPITVIGLPAGRGPNPAAKPPLMVEADTHALTSPPGFEVGADVEDIR